MKKENWTEIQIVTEREKNGNLDIVNLEILFAMGNVRDLYSPLRERRILESEVEIPVNLNINQRQQAVL